MTKPFQSLRQLMNRMLGDKSSDADSTSFENSTLGIREPEPELMSSARNIEAQTADTQRLPQVSPEVFVNDNGHEANHAQHDHELEDALLDVDDFSDAYAFGADDEPILDIDFDLEPPLDNHFAADADSITSNEVRGEMPAEDSVVSEPTFSVAVEALEPHINEEVDTAPNYHSDVSPEAMDAIARRVVEQLSDRVVREIAWEIVPELSELIIKQKLEAR